MALDSVAAPGGRVDVSALLVFDEVIPDFPAYQRMVRALPFASVPMGPVVFHGIAPCPDPTLPAWIRARCPAAVPGLSICRQSPAGQVEPSFVHTDRDMGDWTAILYLTDDPRPDDGTTFWRHRATGAAASTAMTANEFADEGRDWRHTDRWEPWHTVAAVPNRLLLFPAPCFHSRAIFDNYGTGAGARLIQLVFGTGSLREGVCVS
jgi:hypothetical protein